MPVPGSLREAVVIVTGAGGFLGGAVARELARRGARLVLSDLPGVGLEGASHDAARVGEDPIVAPAEVRDPVAVDAVVETCLSAHGTLDGLVHVAGGRSAMLGGGPDKDVCDLSDQDWDLVVTTTLTGAFNWIRAGGLAIGVTGGGSIVVVSSGPATRPGARTAADAAAEAGVVGLVEGAARDLGPRGVRVDAIDPGPILHEGMPPAEGFAGLVCDLMGRPAVSSQVFDLDGRIVS